MTKRCPICKKILVKVTTPWGEEYLRCWTASCHQVLPLYRKSRGKWIKIYGNERRFK